jgi:S-layer protein (TIGR01564 family)
LNKKTAYAEHTSLDTFYNISGMKDKNLILVGGPCVNWISAYFMDYPKDCTSGFQQNKGYLQLFRNGKGIILMVAGYSAEDTRQAARIVANYKDFSANFIGDKVRVSSAWIDEIKVR